MPACPDEKNHGQMDEADRRTDDDVRRSSEAMVRLRALYNEWTNMVDLR